MFFTIAAIKSANRKAGQHFFDRDTLEHWHSRVVNDAVPLSYVDGALFITSEQYEGETGPRVYSVRRALPNGHVEPYTMGKLSSEADARQAAWEIATDYRKRDSEWSADAARAIIDKIINA